MKILIILLLFTQYSFSADRTEERRSKIFNIINEELTEVRELSKQYKGRKPDLNLRIAELYLEKARLIKEKENKKFLTIDEKKRGKLTKNNFFKNSTRLFLKAERECQYILKKSRKYSKISDVYYVLAYIAKELSQFKKARKFFKLASKKSKKNSKTRGKSNLALANLYFNQNNFSKALPLYNKSLNKYDDKWWTKDAFNMAWSYYRLKKYKQAIKLMKRIYKRSENSHYIDMRFAVVRDIGLFYADARKIKSGITFYKKLGKDFATELLKLSNRLKKKGQLAQAQTVLLQALLAEKDLNKRVRIKIAQLELYDTFGKDRLHYEASSSLVNDFKAKRIDQDDAEFEILKYQVARKAAILQKKVVSKGFKKIQKFRYNKGLLAIKYFNLQKVLEPKQSDKVQFLQGETSYVIGKYSDAISYYQKSFDIAMIKNSRKMAQASIDGMLHVVSIRKLKNKNKYYEGIYTRYLRLDSKSKKAVLIYQKLFKVHLSNGQAKKATVLLNTFRDKHPENAPITEAMIAVLMEYHLKKNNLTAVKKWISMVEKGDYTVSGKYKATLKNLLTKIQMKEAQTSLNKGDKINALRGYLTVFNKKKSTLKAKKNSAYNLAILFYELDNDKEVLKWALESLKLMDSKDIKKFSSTFLTFSSYFFEKQEVEKSYLIAEKSILKLCNENINIKSLLFLNNAYILMSDMKLVQTELFITKYKKCSISVKDINKVRYELAKQYNQKNQYAKLESNLKIIEKSSKMRSKTIYLWDTIRKNSLASGNGPKAKDIETKQFKYYKASKRRREKIPLRSLEVISKLKLPYLEAQVKNLDSIKLAFPENKYNNILKNKINSLKRLTESAKTIVDIGASTGIVRSFKILINSYRKVGREVASFRPKGKSASFIKSFVKAMGSISKPLVKQANKYEKTLRRDIVRNDLLTNENAGVFSGKNSMNIIFNSPLMLMDRRGRK